MPVADILQPACDIDDINNFPLTNTGVFEGRQFTDWVSGKISGIKYEVVLPSGDWRSYVPVGEVQWFPTFDTFNCTGFSNCNTAEIQLKRQTGIEFNFSDRAMSVLAQCTPSGNWLYKPADVGRNIGRILERDYPKDFENPATWNQYNKPLTQDILKKLIKFDESYEWVGTDKASLLYHLKQAPIQITIPHTDPVHAVVLIYIEGNNYYYFDSYEWAMGFKKVGGGSFIKVMDTPPASALKIVVKMNTNAVFVHKANSQEYGFYLPKLSADALRDMAMNLGLPEIIKPDSTVDFSLAKEVSGL